MFFEKIVRRESVVWAFVKTVWSLGVLAIFILAGIEMGVFKQRPGLSHLDETMCLMTVVMVFWNALVLLYFLVGIRKLIAWIRLSWNYGCYCHQGTPQRETIEKYLSYLGQEIVAIEGLNYKHARQQKNLLSRLFRAAKVLGIIPEENKLGKYFPKESLEKFFVRENN